MIFLSILLKIISFKHFIKQSTYTKSTSQNLTSGLAYGTIKQVQPSHLLQILWIATLRISSADVRRKGFETQWRCICWNLEGVMRLLLWHYRTITVILSPYCYTLRKMRKMFVHQFLVPTIYDHNVSFVMIKYLPWLLWFQQGQLAWDMDSFYQEPHRWESSSRSARKLFDEILERHYYEW